MSYDPIDPYDLQPADLDALRQARRIREEQRQRRDRRRWQS